MKTYCLYYNPSDYPKKYVVRVFNGEKPEAKPLCVSDSLKEVMKKIPSDVTYLPRMKSDDPVILGTFI